MQGLSSPIPGGWRWELWGFLFLITVVRRDPSSSLTPLNTHVSMETCTTNTENPHISISCRFFYLSQEIHFLLMHRSACIAWSPYIN